MPGAGKSEAVKVARERGFQVLRMGDAVWDEVRGRGLPLEAEAVGRIASEMRVTHGPDIWAKRTLEAVDKKADIVVIDGIRSDAELMAFRETLGADFLLVLIDCSDDVRIARVTSRGRDDDTVTQEAFLDRDQRELGWGLGDVVAAAEHVIPNEGTVLELRRRVGELLDKLASP
jgi:dephospho-CoA kinase